MKINKIIGLVAFTMAFTACQNDMLESDLQQNKIYTLSGKMSAGNTMSRAQIQVGNSNSSEEYAYWNEGDAFALYQSIDNQLYCSVFNINSDYIESGDNKQSATFSTQSPAEVDVVYRAIYPAHARIEYNSVKMDLQHELNFYEADTETKKASVWSNYLQNNMYMMAEGTLTSAGENVVNFRHLCALARVTYTNATDEAQVISSVNFGGDQNFTTSISYNLNGGYQDGGGSTNGYEIMTYGLTVEAGESTDLYFFFFPSDFNLGGEMHLNVNTNSDYKGVRLATTVIQDANGGASGFEAGKRYWFKVTEHANGLAWSKDFSMEAVTFESKEFSIALQKALGEDMVTLNEDSLAVMEGMDVMSVTSLNFPYNTTLTSLDGIEHFKNLEVLGCNGIGLESCDLSKNTKLFYLDLSWNNLTSLDLSNNPKLQDLLCSFNENLSELNLSNCTNLSQLNVENTALEALVIPNPSIIGTLYYGNTKIPTFDLTGFNELRTLDMDNMNLDNLDLIPSPIKAQLETLFIDDNNLNVLDLNEFSNLRDLHCNRNNITKLDLTATPNLRSLMCMENQIDSLDISSWSYIGYLAVGNQRIDVPLTLTMTETLRTEYDENNPENANVTVVITEAPVTGNTITIKNPELAIALQDVLGARKVTIDPDYGYAIMTEKDVLATTELDFSWREYTVSSLNGIEFFVNLTSLRCAGIGLENCNFSSNNKLLLVDVQCNNLTTLDLSHCPEIEQLFCNGMPDLYNINLTGCTKLFNLQAQATGVTSLDIPNPEAMTNFLLPQGVDLDLNTFPNLTGVGLDQRHLSSLDIIPDNIKGQLLYLSLEDNALTELDLTEYPNLTGLNCSYNQIGNLDVSTLSNLGYLVCGSQKNDIILTLSLTDSQKSMWDSQWSSLWGNDNVTFNVVSTGSVGGGTSSVE